MSVNSTTSHSLDLNGGRAGRVEWPTCGAEVEEAGQVAAAGQPRVGLAQLVKEGVRAGL